jgi:chromosome segregation ATPase
MTSKIESDYDTGWREGYEAASGQAHPTVSAAMTSKSDEEIEADEAMDTFDELVRQCDELRARLAESESENGQWQKKVAELWAERERINSEWREQIQQEHAAYQDLLAQANRTAGIYEKEIGMLRTENERAQRQLTAEHETAIAAIAGSEKEILRLRMELHRVSESRAAIRNERDVEIERLRAAIRDYLENDSQANWDALAALVPEPLDSDKES